MEKVFINVTNKRHLNHTDKLIYSVISDLSTYEAWWPGAKFVQLDENTLEVSPAGPGSFTWSIDKTVPNEKFEVLYEGIFVGHGVWSLERDGAMTHLTYSVGLEINHPFYRFINKFVSIKKMHAKMMEKVFISLDRYLNNLHIEHSHEAQS